MKDVQHIERGRKVALCRVCGGTGEICAEPGTRKGLRAYILGRNMSAARRATCPQCEGSGRVWVSCVTDLTVETYKPGEQPGEQ